MRELWSWIAVVAMIAGTVAVLLSSRIKFAMPPVELGDRIADATGLEDIHFESVEFSERFNVMSADRRFAWSLVEPRLMAALLDAPPGLSVTAGGSWVAVLRVVGRTVPAAFPFSGSEGGVSVADLDRVLDEATRVLALFPRTLSPTGAS